MVSEEVYNNRVIAITRFEGIGSYLVRFLDYDPATKSNHVANSIDGLALDDQQLIGRISEMLENNPFYSGAKVTINGVSHFRRERLEIIIRSIEAVKTRTRSSVSAQGVISLRETLRRTGTGD